MNTMKFSPKDAKILKDNPSKSPAELLAAGISRKAYERLKAESQASATVNIEPVKVESAVVSKVTSGKQPIGIVILKNLRTGLTARLKKSTADMLLRTYPRTYKTV